MKKHLPLFLLLFFASLTVTVPQSDNISPARKQAIDSLALEKVKDLRKYISWSHSGMFIVLREGFGINLQKLTVQTNLNL